MKLNLNKLHQVFKQSKKSMGESKQSAALKVIALKNMIDGLEIVQVPLDLENEFLVYIKIEMWAMQLHTILCTDEVVDTITHYWRDDNLNREPLSAEHIESLVDCGVLKSKQLRGRLKRIFEAI